MVGEIKNEYALNDIRIKIAKDNTEGYTLKSEKYESKIDKYGQLDWIEGLFDTQEVQLMELFKINHKKY